MNTYFRKNIIRGSSSLFAFINYPRLDKGKRLFPQMCKSVPLTDVGYFSCEKLSDLILVCS